MAARPIGSMPAPSAPRLADLDHNRAAGAVSAQPLSNIHGHFQDFVCDEESAWKVHMLGLAAGGLMVASGIFGLIDVFNSMGQPIKYVMNSFQVFFGLVTVIVDIKPDYARGLQSKTKSFQSYIFEWALALKLYWGKAVFYFFQGQLALLSSSAISFCSFAGAFMTLVGFVNFQLFWKYGKEAPCEVLCEDYIKINP